MEPTAINVFVTVIVGFGLIAALVGTIFPAFPGLGLAWAATLLFAFTARWSSTSITFMILISLITAVSLGLVIVVPKRATDAAGASRQATWAGIAGAIIGFFAIPVVGFVIGGAGGVYLAEYRLSRNPGTAWTSTKGTLKGFGIAALIQVCAVLAITVIWLGWAFLEFRS